MIDLSIFKTPEEIQMDVAKHEKLYRKVSHMTQKELADRSGVSLGSLKRFEQTGEISFSSLIKIAFVLDCQDQFEELFVRTHYNSIEEVIDERKYSSGRYKKT